MQGEPPVPQPGPKKPLIPHRFSVVQFWTRDHPDKPEIVEGRSSLNGPSGKAYGFVPHAIDLRTFKNLRVNTTSLGFPWEGEGMYEVVVQIQTGKRWEDCWARRFFRKGKFEGETNSAVNPVSLATWHYGSLRPSRPPSAHPSSLPKPASSFDAGADAPHCCSCRAPCHARRVQAAARSRPPSHPCSLSNVLAVLLNPCAVCCSFV